MNWIVLLHDAFDDELASLAEDLQDELLAHAALLAQFGPNLGRPTVDTLKASRHTNMKELRFAWNGEVWRVAFARTNNTPLPLTEVYGNENTAQAIGGAINAWFGKPG